MCKVATPIREEKRREEKRRKEKGIRRKEKRIEKKKVYQIVTSKYSNHLLQQVLLLQYSG